MSYATVAELVAEFGEAEIRDLTDRADPPNGTVDDSVAQRSLDAADAEIDGALAARYAVPMVPTPAIIKTIALDLARYSLYTNAVPETVASRHRNAVRLLKAMSDGTMQLGVSATASTVATNLVQSESSERVFSRGARGL